MSRRPHPDFTRGYAYEVYTGRQGWQERSGGVTAIGAALKDTLTRAGAVVDLHGGVRRVPAAARERVSLNHGKKDKWGMPTLDIDMALRSERAASCGKDMEALRRRDAAGGRVAVASTATATRHIPAKCIHEMGTARMGRDPKTSVLNALQPVPRRAERVRHRRRLHGVDRVPEPVAHLHGADGARLRSRREGAAPERLVRRQVSECNARHWPVCAATRRISSEIQVKISGYIGH